MDTPVSASGKRLTSKGQATRSRVIDAAAKLMRAQGVGRTSLEEVETAASVNTSQLYHYFSDKADLTLAVLDHQTESVLAGQRPVLDELTSFAAFEAWADLLVAAQHEALGRCPIGSISTELSDLDPKVRTAVCDGFERWRAPIHEGIRIMRDRGLLSQDIDPEMMSLSMLAAVQGGLLLTHARRDSVALRAVLDTSLKDLRSYETAPKQIESEAAARST